MTTQELKQLKTIVEKATAGPWKSFIEGRDHESGSDFIQTNDASYEIEFINIRDEDQDFIAIARNIMPVLIDELLELKSRL